jgi:hypothetical protein
MRTNPLVEQFLGNVEAMYVGIVAIQPHASAINQLVAEDTPATIYLPDPEQVVLGS